MYGFDYVLSYGGMTSALQGQSHIIRITVTDIEKWHISVKWLLNPVRCQFITI